MSMIASHNYCNFWRQVLQPLFYNSGYCVALVTSSRGLTIVIASLNNTAVGQQRLMPRLVSLILQGVTLSAVIVFSGHDAADVRRCGEDHHDEHQHNNVLIITPRNITSLSPDL